MSRLDSRDTWGGFPTPASAWPGLPSFLPFLPYAASGIRSTSSSRQTTGTRISILYDLGAVQIAPLQFDSIRSSPRPGPGPTGNGTGSGSGRQAGR